MPAKSAMSLADLRTLARSVGVATTGTKTILEQSLSQRLKERRSLRPQTGHGKLRVLSLDMGIRNLAYCLLESDASNLQSSSANTPPSNETIFAHLRSNVQQTVRSTRASEWARIDVLTHAKSLQEPDLAVRPSTDDQQDDSSLVVKQAQLAGTNTFNIHTLAEAASSLVRNVLLPMRPTHIVIERQRHRSGGSANVLEWTFRVNMLEGMLWSSIRTLQDLHKDGKLTDSHDADQALVNILASLKASSVDPKRMSSLWLADGTDMTSPPSPPTSSKARNVAADASESSVAKLSAREVKAARIRLVQGWLSDGSLETTGDADDTRAQVLGAGAVKKAAKKDDLADCLLQGLAFLAWEKNASYLAEMLPQDPPT